MDVSKLKPYAKAVVAFAAALVTTASLLSDGELSADDIVAIVAAWTAVFGVFQVPNVPTLSSIIKNNGKA
jgi:hypothetical protein